MDIKYTEMGETSMKSALQGERVSAEMSQGISTARRGLLAHGGGNVPEPLLATALVLRVILPTILMLQQLYNEPL